MTDVYHQQVLAQLEQARAELAQLHEGEEEYTDERLVPTPSQWIWQWNRATPAERLEVARRVLGDADAALRCFMQDHHMTASRLRAQIADEQRTSADRANEVYRVRQLLRAAEDELAFHRQRAAGRPVETRHLVEVHREGVRVHGDGELTGAGPEALAALLAKGRDGNRSRPTDLADVPASELTPEWRAYLDIEMDKNGPDSETLHVSVPAQMDNQVDNRRGFTVGVYFPPEAPDAVRDAFFDRVAADAHSLDRSDWDAFVIGLAGDPLDIDGEPDGP